MNRVCHFTSVHPAMDGRIFYRECCSLAEGGYEVYLVVPNGNDEVKNGVHIVGVNIGRTGRLKRMFSVAKAVYKKALSLDADIYHFHDPELLRFALKLKRKGKKVIFDSHEFYGLQIREKEYLHGLLRNWLANIYMKYEAYVCRRIDAVIQVCTIEGKDYFRDRCKRSFFVSNAVNLKAFKRDYTSSSVEERNAVIHIGGLTHNRGITTLIKAAGLTCVKIKLAGSFSPKGYHEELKQLKEYENIEYLGVVDKKELPQILNSCFAGISTLLNIGQYVKIDILPTKIYEYMAMSLPVIMSNSPYNVKLNRLYHIGVCVEPSNPKEIAEAINYLGAHPQEAKNMGANGRKLVEDLFNWEIEKRKLLALYAEMI